jgi:HTH-type transcriptional repressor of NAD biosynthesis genes
MAHGYAPDGDGMIRGLVFGKFYPPHRGHQYLIETAAANCDALTVLVMSHLGETIPGELRTTWLQTLYPGLRVIHTPCTGKSSWPEEDEPAWTYFIDFVRRYHGEPIDRLFTSEWYGPSTARRLGAEHVAVDNDRSRFPISATRIRAAPRRFAAFLHPVVRAYYVLRVSACGAESTGKTTLCEALALHYNVPLVLEYGREYSDAMGHTAECPHVWSAGEFSDIARVQDGRIEAAALASDRLVIADTDAFSTELWCERYLNAPVTYGYRHADLYLFTQLDVPFVQDGTRDGQHIRSWMTARFAERLRDENRRFVTIAGPHEERLATAIRAIDEVLESDDRIARP